MPSPPSLKEHELSPRYSSPRTSPRRSSGTQRVKSSPTTGASVGQKSPLPHSGRKSPQHSQKARTPPRRSKSPVPALQIRVIPIDEWYHQPSHNGGYPGAISPRSSGGVTSALTTAHIERQQRIENDRRAREQARRERRVKVGSSLDVTADAGHRREVRLDVCVDGCCAHMGRKVFGVQYNADRRDPARIAAPCFPIGNPQRPMRL